VSKSASGAAIRLRGVRQNNLKNFDLDLPLHRLIVITGLSGSGKSSLAFDTLYAEGQRRYIETFSPYARQFFDRMDKPQVDSIEGIPPAIAIEQRNAIRSTRSTVGTMTEICDHMKILWPHLAQLHCRGCGRPVTKDSPQSVWQALARPAAAPSPPREPQSAGREPHETGEALITFDVPLSEKFSLADSLALIARQGYQRVLVNGGVLRLEEVSARATAPPASGTLTVVQDRLKIAPAARARFIEACEQAYHFGKGRLTVWEMRAPADVRHPRRFSNRRHCAQCDIEYPEATAAQFSFNHPLGACPTCKGFGRTITIDYDLAIPDRTLTLAAGAVKPWRNGFSAECQRDLTKFCHARHVPLEVPFEALSAEHQRWVLEGDPDYGSDEEHEWPRAWYGVKGYFRWLETKAYKMHVRVLLSRYRAYTRCPDCQGARLKPDALRYWLDTASLESNPASCPPPSAGATRLTLPDFYALPIRAALELIRRVIAQRARRPQAAASDPVQLALHEVGARLAYLEAAGLGYLTLDRPMRTLSGGETERVNLTTCLGTRLVNTLFVLDEPSVGLHPRDTDRLVRILERLRDTGNTVVVVEHEAGIMRAADQIVDIGPGHGATGGEIVFQGALPDLLQAGTSLTGQYLSGRQRIAIPPRRPIPHAVENGSAHPAAADPAGQHDGPAMLKIERATCHNLHNLSVEIPLRRFVVVTGVSGSGKSTLIRNVLLPALQARLHPGSDSIAKASDRLDQAENDHGSGADGFGKLPPVSGTLSGYESLRQVALVDQSGLGKTPRSNPAVYIGAFDDIREVFAQSDSARRRGLNASAFSFNSSAGQCAECRGAGFKKIEMQFLSDIFIRCPGCAGRRYRQHILDIKIRSPQQKSPAAQAWSIADLLDASVDEVIDFLAGFTNARSATRAVASLKLLQEVGLGYLRLGQPINTLSGGESQRLKLVRHLAEATQPPAAVGLPARHQTAVATEDRPPAGSTLFLFDEPTTGLHFDDVRGLLQVFQRLVDAGHSVVVIEHNLEVIKCADWIIDLGPEAGADGGRVVATGTPEMIVQNPASHTGRYLRQIGIRPPAPRRVASEPPRPAGARNRSRTATMRSSRVHSKRTPLKKATTHR